MKQHGLVLLIAVLQISPIDGFSMEGCGSVVGCWFHPPKCEETIERCKSSARWSIDGDGVSVQLEATVTGLAPDAGHYLALGFSQDQRMCVINAQGEGKAFISFNDETKNRQLPQASEVMLTETSGKIENDRMLCTGKIFFDRRMSINENDRFKVKNLEAEPWYLLFARGNADRYTLEKQIHSTNDGELFPWMSDEQILICRNCSNTHVLVSEMRQTFVSRWWRYRIAVIHGVFLIFAWWVFGSSAILLARFFKPLWPRKKLLGTAVWFQLHRDLMLFSVLLQVIAVLLIFFQANWVWYQCSYECSSDDFSKKMHTITGVTASVLAVLQPLIAFARPGPNANVRPIFNWIHWFIGMTAWAFASATMILAIPMGKTGLLRVWGHVPNYVMGGYVIVFVLCSIVLEILASTSTERRSEKSSISGTPMFNLAGPSDEHPISTAMYPNVRLFVWVVHLAVALGVAIFVSYMLISILLSHSD